MNMNKKTTTLLIGISLIIASCGSTKFPRSLVVPAAHVEVKVDQDDHDNNVLELKAKHMAHPQRLTPPKQTYVIWTVIEQGRLVNLGQLITSANDKASVVLTTPYDPVELFITAEDDPLVMHPAGTEITRVKLD